MGPVWDLLSFLHENMREVTISGVPDYQGSNNEMLQIKWEDRLTNCPAQGRFASVTTVIDTTECPIACGLTATYSGYKKYNSLKYELGVSVASGRFVWAPTPGLLGPDSDTDCFFHFKIWERFLPGEMFLGDGHYSGLPFSFVPSGSELTIEDQHVRAIVEHAIGKLKHWHCLSVPWHHDLSLHHVAFSVCVNVTNIQFEFQPCHKHPHELLKLDPEINN